MKEKGPCHCTCLEFDSLHSCTSMTTLLSHFNTCSHKGKLFSSHNIFGFAGFIHKWSIIIYFRQQSKHYPSQVRESGNTYSSCAAQRILSIGTFILNTYTVTKSSWIKDKQTNRLIDRQIKMKRIHKEIDKFIHLDSNILPQAIYGNTDMCSTQNYSDELAARLDNKNCLLC